MWQDDGLRVLAGFERPDIGRVTVDGHDVVHVAGSEARHGMVFQSYSLFPNMSARDNVAFDSSFVISEVRHDERAPMNSWISSGSPSTRRSTRTNSPEVNNSAWPWLEH